jgi:hypothetical protein
VRSHGCEEKGQADVVHTSSLHHKMISSAGVFQDLFKSGVVVAEVQVKELTQVVLVTNIQCIQRYINAATKLFCFHCFVFKGETNVTLEKQKTTSEEQGLCCATKVLLQALKRAC